MIVLWGLVRELPRLPMLCLVVAPILLVVVVVVAETVSMGATNMGGMGWVGR